MALKFFSIADMPKFHGNGGAGGGTGPKANARAALAAPMEGHHPSPMDFVGGYAEVLSGSASNESPCGFTPDVPTDPGIPTGADVTAQQMPDWSWLSDTVPISREVRLFNQRFHHFDARGACLAHFTAERLFWRDRDMDDRRLCVECGNCSPRQRCSNGMAVLDVFQRCDYFDMHPQLQEVLV